MGLSSRGSKYCCQVKFIDINFFYREYRIPYSPSIIIVYLAGCQRMGDVLNRLKANKWKLSDRNVKFNNTDMDFKPNFLICRY